MDNSTRVNAIFQDAQDEVYENKDAAVNFHEPTNVVAVSRVMQMLDIMQKAVNELINEKQAIIDDMKHIAEQMTDNLKK